VTTATWSAWINSQNKTARKQIEGCSPLRQAARSASKHASSNGFHTHPGPERGKEPTGRTASDFTPVRLLLPTASTSSSTKQQQKTHSSQCCSTLTSSPAMRCSRTLSSRKSRCSNCSRLPACGPRSTVHHTFAPLDLGHISVGCIADLQQGGRRRRLRGRLLLDRRQGGRC